jgi:predicted RecA/RadA family phage recombinase
MATNIKYDLGVTTLPIPAPVGGATSGAPFPWGPLVVVPEADAAAGVDVSCCLLCVGTFPKVSAQAWTAGDVLYWDTVSEAFTNVAGVYKSVGIAFADAANPSSTGDVVAGMGSEADSEVNTLIADLASTANAKGASLVSIEDVGGFFTATDVEAVLQEAGAVATTALTMVGVGGVGTLVMTAAADRAGSDSALIADDVVAGKPVTVIIASGAASGSSAADAALIGGAVLTCVPVSGSDKATLMAELQGDGSVTVRCGGNQSAEATYACIVEKP